MELDIQHKVITVQEKLQIAMPKKASMYLLDRTTQAKILGLYVPWAGFYKSDVGLRKFLIFVKVTGQNSSKIQYGRHFKTVFCL